MAELKQLMYKFLKGMLQDLDELSDYTGSAYELLNLKILNTEDTIKNSLTNEKGTEKIKIRAVNIGNAQETAFAAYTKKLYGDVIGVILCTDTVVTVFTHKYGYVEHGVDDKSYYYTFDGIYRLDYAICEVAESPGEDALSVGEEYIKATLLAYAWGMDEDLTYVTDTSYPVLEGKAFNFSPDNLISGLFVYENSELQKVYWVDGRNQLRFINIAFLDATEVIPITDVEKLNSSPSFKVNHHFEAKKVSGTGSFPAGVILYCFTYFNKYGAETNIVDMTPLYYIADDDRGIPANESKSCAYEISLQNPDTSFEYARVYSILRTSYSGEPVVKVVGDIKLKK